MVRLISFDIDGTLEIGDPPGVVTMAAVRRAIELGMLVGSCSDRPVSYQQELWSRHNVDVHFTVVKMGLKVVKTQFDADHYLHIGDTPVDQMVAEEAGFDFLHVVDDDIEAFLLENQLWE